MHVAKRMAVLAMMAALSMVLILLGTVIPVNTLFFTAAAAYMTGIAVVLYGKVQGSVYFAVCLSLDFFLNPDKLHVFLFVLFGGYILISEITYRLLTEKRKDRTKERIHRVIRLCLFMAGYVPMVCLVPDLFVEGTTLSRWVHASWFIMAAVAAGVIFWWIYDAAYGSFKGWFYEKFKHVVK